MNENLSNSDLIDFVYYEIACEKMKAIDFSNYAEWKKVVSEMALPIATVYRIGILNQQVMNGGFIQYFDNGYGIFAQETVEDFKRIGAHLSFEILNRCLTLINPKGYEAERFFELVSNQEYESYESLFTKELNELDRKYFNLDDDENLEDLLAAYLRQSQI
ncbi:DMP19 family protein [Flavobacterium caeni]|uniref:DNA mimic protein DMP19 C-terminal domain-containing protein n=1 Tax=Flavobacterium caeni TaxID=490189 RepID=A0A1G5KAX3_9FLAO|nr:DUF4375 domain-containing protein [Flavobacterium caeni]SCY97441.1 protein of unknown function [Flavobacterium caeni]